MTPTNDRNRLLWHGSRCRWSGARRRRSAIDAARPDVQPILLRRVDAPPAAGSVARLRSAGWSRSRSASPRSGSLAVIEQSGVAHLEIVWHTLVMDATLVLGQQGRLVIPADVRTMLGLAAGDRLHLHLVGQRVVLERQVDAAAELRGLASEVPEARSLVDELLAERRLAASAAE